MKIIASKPNKNKKIELVILPREDREPVSRERMCRDIAEFINLLMLTKCEQEQI